MESLNFLLLIILLIFAVLQIVLFFKIWGMTNDIKSIKEKINPKDRLWETKRAILKGNKEMASSLIVDAMLDDIQASIFSHYGSMNSMKEVKEKYEPIFEKVEVEMPEAIRKLESFSDVTNLLKQK